MSGAGSFETSGDEARTDRDEELPGGDDFLENRNEELPGGDDFLQNRDEELLGGDDFLQNRNEELRGGDDFLRNGDEADVLHRGDRPSRAAPSRRRRRNLSLAYRVG